MLGSSFKVDQVFLMYFLFEFCFNWLSLAGVRKYLLNHCPLAANFGTKACGFAVGVWFCISESSCWGGYFVYFLLSDAVFLCYRDIFSVTKLTRALVIVQAACYYVVLSVLTWVEKYMNICHEFSLNLCWCCSCWVEESAILFLFILAGFFYTHLYTYVLWWIETSGGAFSS
jgi:hypothetical protein